MDDETIELPLAPKKPYVRPQLHWLTGSGAYGKSFPLPIEFGSSDGPS